jgi:ribosomal protein L29
MFWPAIAIIVVASSYFNFQKTKLKVENGGGNQNSKEFKDLKKKVDFLLEENEELKEDLEQMKFLMGVGDKDSKSLDISKYRRKEIPKDNYTDYEKEQIRIDNQDKLNY